MSKKDIDQGWAWVVLLAAATSMAIGSISTTAIGIFQVEFLESFQGSRSVISMICSVHVGFQLIIGPLASVICNTYSIRVAAMTGAALLSLGYLLSSLSTTFEEVLVFYGLCAGGGFGIMYTSVSVITNHYFHDKRIIACGITFATPGLGYIIGPTLTRYLIELVGWRFTMGVYSCMTIQICVLSALFFPIDENRKTCCPSIFSNTTKKDKVLPNGDVEASVPLTRSLSPKRIKDIMSESHLEIPQTHPCDKIDSTSLHKNEHNLDIMNDHSVPKYSLIGDESPALSNRKCLYRNGINTSLYSVNSHNSSDVHVPNHISNKFITSVQTINSLSQHHRYGSGSIMWQSHWSMQHVGAYLAHEEALETGEDFEEPTKTSCLPDFSALKVKSLWVLSLSQFLMQCGYGVNFIHFPSMVISNGIDISAVPHFYMTHGVTMIFARIIGGLFCSSEDINILVVAFGCQVVLGAAVFCVPFFGSNIWAYHLYFSAFAMYYGGSYILLTQILVKILGLKHLATGFGLQLMVAGLTFFMTPSLAGWLYDITGSYNLAYHCAGAVIFVGAFFVLAIQVLEPLTFMEESSRRDIIIEVEELSLAETKT